ncbi:unnamed protein product [Clonostachys rosea]|uniref:Uncharacterized protein n=1 Tax=Bionectria ochroleuca TaxID=29856 RepID=A0ABY6UEW9_BIOOC|nr:unnamed protein product [Clonostachys rosea]
MKKSFKGLFSSKDNSKPAEEPSDAAETPDLQQILDRENDAPSDIPLATIKKWSDPLITPTHYGQFPVAMTLQFAAKGEGRMQHHFALVTEYGGGKMVPLYAVTIDNAARLSMVVHAEPNVYAPPLSFAGQERAFRSTAVNVTARPTAEGDTNHVERMTTHVVWEGEILRFGSYVGMVGGLDEHYERFEWRRKSGEDPETKAFERRLVRMSTSTEEHEDVICKWSGKGWWRKWDDNSVGTITFYGAGATGELGPRLTLMAVTTALRAVKEDMSWKEIGRLAKDGGEAAMKAAILAGAIGIKVGLSVGFVGRRNQSKLLKRRQCSLLASLVHDQTILESENGGAGKVNLLAGVGLIERTDGKVIEGHTSVSATTNPAANNIGTTRD